MALKVSGAKAAEVAIGSIGRGYDISADLRLKFCKGESSDSRLIEIDEHHCQEIALPGGINVPNVPNSVKCDKGERTRFRSDVLSFQQVLYCYHFYFFLGYLLFDSPLDWAQVFFFLLSLCCFIWLYILFRPWIKVVLGLDTHIKGWCLVWKNLMLKANSNKPLHF